MNQETAAEILRVVNGMSEAFQSTVTDEERAALDVRHAEEPDTVAYPAVSLEDALMGFTIDAISMLVVDMHTVLDGRIQSLYRQALEVYYVSEELARDPKHAHLAAHVEAMRLAHEKEYGYPPPPRSPA